jgi:hypothetical protein
MLIRPVCHEAEALGAASPPVADTIAGGTGTFACVRRCAPPSRRCWTALGAGFIITLSVHYHEILVKTGVPKGVVVGGFILFFVVLLLPIPVALGAPLLQRARYGTREVNRVVK